MTEHEEFQQAVQANKHRKQRLARYGLTQSNFLQMKAAQGFRCAGCGKPFKNQPQIDHSHKTGKVRGLLCRSCNSTLGMAKDSIKRLRGLIAYLKKNLI